MARRTRSVEKVYRRQKFIDRIVVGVLLVASAAGLMSVLPGAAQGSVRRLGCRIGSLGLGACGQQVSTTSATPLGAPRCPELEQLDSYLPEVSSTRFTLPDGLHGRLLRSRAGDITVDFGFLPNDPPDVLAGQQRGTRQLMPGVTVAKDAEWWQPGGQGADSVLQAIVDARRRYRLERSPLALFAALDNGRHGIPEPTVRYSSTRVGRANLPGPESRPATPHLDRWIAIDGTQPAVISYNRITQETSLIARVSGSIEGRPTSGAVRVTRDAAGRPTQIMVALASDESPAPDRSGLPGRTGLPGRSGLQGQTASATYIVIPVTTTPERTLADRWLSSPTGFSLDLSPLLGWTEPTARDQLNAWLSRAATVTILTSTSQAAGNPTAADRVVRELTTLRRAQQSAPLRRVTIVAPQPDGSQRVPVTDQQCVDR